MEEAVKVKKTTKKDYVYAVGRRRESVARVRLYQTLPAEQMWGGMMLQKGELYVNEKPITTYFSGDVNKKIYLAPFVLTDTLNKYTVTARIIGGGPKGQMGALLHGIARALAQADTKAHHKALRDAGYLTRDARARQRRNVGTGGKARRAKQSPKR